MHRIVLVLAAAACLTACRSKPAPPAPAPFPRFAGSVGQQDDGDAFVAFVSDHDHQTVTLDVSFPARDFQGGEEPEFSFFTVFDNCENLPDEGKPDVFHCTGTEYNIPHARGSAPALVQDGGSWRLRGQFRLESAGGPNQGLMSVNLVAAPQGSRAGN